MSNLSLIPVTSKNRRAIEKLKVFPHQTGFIESVADCMKEADQLAAWHPMCIYDNDTLIGFTMYGMIQEPAYTRLWFDRLLIDKQHQGKGDAVRSCPSVGRSRGTPHLYGCGLGCSLR